MKKKKKKKYTDAKITILWQDIGIDFDIEKWAVLIRKGWKRQITEVIEPPSKERIRTLGEKENY